MNDRDQGHPAGRRDLPSHLRPTLERLEASSPAERARLIEQIKRRVMPRGLAEALKQFEEDPKRTGPVQPAA